VEEQKEKELKSKIAEIYTKYHDEPDRRQAYWGQLLEWIYKWCRRHIFYKKTEYMGEEIVKAVKRCVEREKMPPEEFLKYLGVSLYNARNEFYRNDPDIENSVKVTNTNKERKNLIRLLEEEKNRKLEPDELINLISDWKGINGKKARAYLEGNIINDTVGDDNEKELNRVEGQYLTPEKEATEEADAETIKYALETVLNEYHDKMEPFYRALFTMRYIKRKKNYERLLPILNAEILEMFKKNKKIPTQYEIYMIYHPGAGKSTAETNASQMSKKFFEDINKAGKEKDPDFVF